MIMIVMSLRKKNYALTKLQVQQRKWSEKGLKITEKYITISHYGMTTLHLEQQIYPEIKVAVQERFITLNR